MTPGRIWVEGDYCVFHPKLDPKNRERIKFVHGQMVEDGKTVFYKSCPKCYVLLRYPEGIAIKTPQIITNV